MQHTVDIVKDIFLANAVIRIVVAEQLQRGIGDGFLADVACFRRLPYLQQIALFTTVRFFIIVEGETLAACNCMKVRNTC